jgi:starch phosphorylase
MVMADFTAYVEAQREVARAFKDPEVWTTMSIRNVARTGRFSSDRTIHDYASEIWEASSVPIDYDA